MGGGSMKLRKNPMSKEKETTEQRLKRFEKAYNILMDYFNDLPEETRIEVDERLNKVNL